MDQKWKERVNLPQSLRAQVSPEMVRVAPGEYAPLDPKRTAPAAVLSVWRATGSGTYRAEPITDRMLRLNQQLAKVLGFQGSYDTIYRLGRAGFIEIVKVAPHTTLLNVDSYYRHLRACADDPWFWENEERAGRYSEAVRL